MVDPPGWLQVDHLAFEPSIKKFENKILYLDGHTIFTENKILVIDYDSTVLSIDTDADSIAILRILGTSIST